MNEQISRDVIEHAMKQLSARADEIRKIIYLHPAAELHSLHQEVRERMSASQGVLNPDLCKFLESAVIRERELKKQISLQRKTAALSLELLNIEQQLEHLNQELLLVVESVLSTTQETFTQEITPCKSAAN